jgi:hypothetical protein
MILHQLDINQENINTPAECRPGAAPYNNFISIPHYNGRFGFQM